MEYTPKLLVWLVARCFSVLPYTEKSTSKKKNVSLLPACKEGPVEHQIDSLTEALHLRICQRELLYPSWYRESLPGALSLRLRVESSPPQTGCSYFVLPEPL